MEVNEMKLFDKTTGETIADIVTNHSMSVDEALDLMRYTVNDDGQTPTPANC